MPVYEDEKAKENPWWYEFEGGKVNGKRNRIKERGFASEKDAKIAMVAAQDEFNKGKRVKTNKTLFKDYILKRWLASKTDISKDTKKIYTIYIRVHISDSQLGNTQMLNIDPEIIEITISELFEKELAESTIRKIFNIINTSLKHAVKLKLIKENPCDGVHKPSVSVREFKIWDVEQVRTFIDYSKGKTRYDFTFVMALYTGIRQGELLGLRWKDVDFNRKIIRITQTLSHRDQVLKKGAKTRTSVRVVAITDETVSVLMKQKNIIEHEKKLANENYKDLDLVVCTSNGTPVSPRNLLRVFYNVLDDEPMKDVLKISWHEMRHTHASILLLNNVHIKIVSERLGHASIKITLDLYSHLLPHMQEDAIKGFDELFNKLPEVNNVSKNLLPPITPPIEIEAELVPTI